MEKPKKTSKKTLILAIETSCDETAISVLECSGNALKPQFKILANEIVSQIEIHKEYGGVFPALAKREHEKALPILLGRILKKIKMKDLDVIAVTVGPGLEPALWTGIVFAQALAKTHNLPIVPVNHMEGHLLSSILASGAKVGKQKVVIPSFPVLSLLVSGGHTELVYAKDFSGKSYKKIGETLDDACGEAFDKVARMLGLPYPGGPEISKLAEKFQTRLDKNEKNLPTFLFPRPMIGSKDFNFSYSGLKTSVLYTIKKMKKVSELEKESIAHAFERAAIDVLIHKTKKALLKYCAETLLGGGGVAKNEYLRKSLVELKNKMKKEGFNFEILFPRADLSTDNSLMIGIAGYFEYLKNKRGAKISSLRAFGSLSL